MKVSYHPEFSEDILRFGAQYSSVSVRLESRFRAEVDEAILKIKEAATSAGHFLNTGSAIVREVRRRNLVSFPYFVLYGVHDETLIFGAIIPKASDPLTWLKRFSDPA
jgi:hypothetical protein